MSRRRIIEIGMAAIPAALGLCFFLSAPSVARYFLGCLSAAPMIHAEFRTQEDRFYDSLSGLIAVSLVGGIYYSIGRFLVLPAMATIAAPFVVIWWTARKIGQTHTWARILAADLAITDTAANGCVPAGTTDPYFIAAMAEVNAIAPEDSL